MLLAIDTATRSLSIALHDGQAVIAESTWQSATRHTVELAPQVALLARRAGVELARLHALAVTIGPGSYTGLRIGLGFAKGLALARGLPVVGVSTFEPLLRAQPPRAEPVIAVLQAGRGRISAGRFVWEPKRRVWQPDRPAEVLDWPGLAAGLDGPVYVCGELDAAGSQALRELARRGQVHLASSALSLRRAGFLAEIGWERLRSAPGAGEPQSASRLAPQYGSAPEGAAA
jgi:tRNA threonylcarbamoyladenosine biosynthesis protein TsaB